MLRQILAGSLMMGLVLQAPASLAKGNDGFDQVELADNLSQLIRSNAVYFWQWAKTAELGALTPYTAAEGIVAGDPHLGNFSVIPADTKRGGREMRFVNVDFDDAGRGPFALDFVRFMVASEAINREIKKGDLERAYLAGLRGEEMAAPAIVQELLDMSVEDYESKMDRYVAKHIDGGKFDFSNGRVEKYNGKITKASLEKIFAGMTVLDLARRPKERGGSVDGLRVWVLVNTAEDRSRIYELKEVEVSGMASFQTQPSMKRLLPEIQAAFWPGLTGDDYSIVDVPGAGEFWLREKRKVLIDIPYSSEKAKKLSFVKELSSYDANQLGLAHGRQASSRAYRAMIENDPKAFHRAIEPIVREFLKAAQAALNAKN